MVCTFGSIAGNVLIACGGNVGCGSVAELAIVVVDVLSVVGGGGGVCGKVCGAANGVVLGNPNVKTSGGTGGNRFGRTGTIGCVQQTNRRPLLNLSLRSHKSFLNKTKSK